MSEEIPIFFDFGGTLVDTLKVTQHIFKETLGKDFTPDKIKQMYKDASKKRQSMMMFFKYPVNPIKLLLKQKKMKKMQNEVFVDIIELLPKAKETLKKIKEIDDKLLLVLVTQNPVLEKEEESQKVLEKLFGDENPFDLILAGEDKFELIVHNFDADSIAKGLIVGDLPNDVYVAEMLKIPCFGVTWGYGDEGELETPFIVDDFDELPEMVKEHLEDLEEDQEEEIEEIEFEEIEFDEYELID